MAHSAVHRLPAEIWIEILDILLIIPHYFDVDCSLPSLLEWSWEPRRRISQINYAISENQRLAFARVCRSWRAYAESRANRAELISTAVPRSRRITIEDVEVEHPRVSTRWEVLIAKLRDEGGHGSGHFRRIAQNIHLHKNIKRIDLRIIGEIKIPDLFHILPAFSMLVCLSIVLDNASGLSPPPEPIPLPNLMTLILRIPYILQYPHEMFEIPSLINLHFAVTEGEHSFQQVLRPYHKTLKNLGVFWTSPAIPRMTYTFPGWDFFPHLEELVFDGWESHTPLPPSPLPPTHPLKVVRMDRITWPIIDLLLPTRYDPNILERNSIQKINILTLLWSSGGYRDPNGFHRLDQSEMAQVHVLVNQCSHMGIRLEDRTAAPLDDPGNPLHDVDSIKAFLEIDGMEGYEFDYPSHDEQEVIIFG